jgi:hypothetical protein
MMVCKQAEVSVTLALPPLSRVLPNTRGRHKYKPLLYFDFLESIQQSTQQSVTFLCWTSTTTGYTRIGK